MNKQIEKTENITLNYDNYVVRYNKYNDVINNEISLITNDYKDIIIYNIELNTYKLETSFTDISSITQLITKLDEAINYINTEYDETNNNLIS